MFWQYDYQIGLHLRDQKLACWVIDGAGQANAHRRSFGVVGEAKEGGEIELPGRQISCAVNVSAAAIGENNKVMGNCQAILDLDGAVE